MVVAPGRGLPTWNLQRRESVVSLPFRWNESKSGRRLPAEVAVRMFAKAPVGASATPVLE